MYPLVRVKTILKKSTSLGLCQISWETCGLCLCSNNTGPIIIWIPVQIKVCCLTCLLVNSNLNWGTYSLLFVWVENCLTFLDYKRTRWGKKNNELDFLGGCVWLMRFIWRVMAFDTSRMSGLGHWHMVWYVRWWTDKDIVM